MPRLRPFQREDVDFLKQHGLRALVASAPGTGKTPVAIRALAECHPASFPAVIVCPASVTRNWAREFRRWAPGIKPVIIEDGDSPLPRGLGRSVVYIISWALLDARWADLVRAGVQVVVADEAHYAKNPDAIRSRALHYLTKQARGVMLLTGTPVVNTQAELQVLQDLLGTTEPPMIRRLLEDVAPDIPEKKRSYVHIKLRPNHQKVYDQADEDFEEWLRSRKESLLGEGMAEFEIERTLAAEALAKIGYLRRLVGEYKVPAAADWIARAVRLGEPVVVFLEHQATLKRLTRALRKQRIRFGVLEGSTSAKQRQALVDEFQKHEFPVFIATRAGKEGITLTAARHLLFVERFFTSADEEQAEDRIRRIGQKHKTTIWYLHAVDTVDDRIDAIVRTKRQIVRTAIGAADTAETSVGNVQSLLQSWSDYVAEDRETKPLGLGDPLDPLPRPKETHAIVFSEDRWTPLAALRWCRMHGYEPARRIQLAGRFKLVVHPAAVFEKGAFSLFPVSRDIKVVTGARLSRSSERRIRRVLAGER
jgi:SWI/SNF-related matrix-associated actin-dependent regulator 1 of chromatin subfamily A